jgi:hypothetical protein
VPDCAVLVSLRIDHFQSRLEPDGDHSRARYFLPPREGRFSTPRADLYSESNEGPVWGIKSRRQSQGRRSVKGSPAAAPDALQIEVDCGANRVGMLTSAPASARNGIAAFLLFIVAQNANIALGRVCCARNVFLTV